VTTAESEPDLARVTISTELEPGQTLTVVKLLAYGWSSGRSMPALRDQVDAALAAAKHTGWDGLLAGQRAYLDGVWERADVELEGDPEMQQAVRFALFQVVQAAARAEQRAIPAKGLTGRGYDGHSFWDMDSYLLPVLTYAAPGAARDILRWRHSTLALARVRASELRLAGAAFPWRTIRHRAARRDGAPVAVAWASRRAGALSHRRCDRPRRVHGAGRQQRLHQPDGGSQSARRRRIRAAAPGSGSRARGGRTRGRRLARGG
jgi:trehalose/maltose hydrolase-like predicted phosphorylase